MSESTSKHELYQQVILEHNKKPRNFKKIDNPTHFAEGYNPLCGDHLMVYLSVDDKGIIQEISFEGSGCAISKASASMMTVSLKGKTLDEARKLFEQFHKLVIGKLHPEKDAHTLGKLSIFSGIWQYPARVKCAILSWHAMNGAINKVQNVSTEN
ncbi:MAG TPA: SUF system NifU family Fe-S cluster assembly protein [Candidatus Omnitrophota bacterium]|nr:SUF system NifU family Fe-S cluster assembly protein [Candidatus Omnitrophota bacterium]HPD85372.1 SUF system NifU family Fe-S cluster assembly protein [Candidatus Omnitrophota bacterium]HRZ04127.1 SUF system NifU family Fe-S cluster assembly protein [Candidatus Omnitrophota bacterium]